MSLLKPKFQSFYALLQVFILEIKFLLSQNADGVQINRSNKEWSQLKVWGRGGGGSAVTA